MPFPIETLATFLANAPVASTPGPSDVILLLQGGAIKQLPTNTIPQLAVAPTVVVNQSVYNASLINQVIFVQRSPAATTTINLPSNPGAGREILIKDIAGNVSGGNPINISNCVVDGAVGATITTNYGYLRLISTGNGNNWAVVT